MENTDEQRGEQRDELASAFRSRPAPERIVRPSPLIECEDADGFIYCYYFPYVRSLAQKAGKKRWPCKIGRTQGDINECIAGQFSQSGIFEMPEVGLAAHVKDHKKFERALHTKFKARRLKTAGAGDEWFEVTLSEVHRAFREVRWPGTWNLPKRLRSRIGL